jgi:hypothetical protein
MSWDAYRAANPLLQEMREYNTRVRDRVVLKKKVPTTPQQEMDRYQALGIPYPNAKTMCLGQCEGTGIIPIHGKDWKDPSGKKDQIAVRVGSSSEDADYQKLWQEAEDKEPTDDGWHFVKCLDCGGTGKRKTAEESLKTCIHELRTLVD